MCDVFGVELGLRTNWGRLVLQQIELALGRGDGWLTHNIGFLFDCSLDKQDQVRAAQFKHDVVGRLAKKVCLLACVLVAIALIAVFAQFSRARSKFVQGWKTNIQAAVEEAAVRHDLTVPVQAMKPSVRSWFRTLAYNSLPMGERSLRTSSQLSDAVLERARLLLAAGVAPQDADVEFELPTHKDSVGTSTITTSTVTTSRQKRVHISTDPQAAIQQQQSGRPKRKFIRTGKL